MGILDRLGLAPKAQIDSLRTELDTLKASMPNFEKWMLATAGAEQYNMPDPSVFGNQADLYRKLSWVLLAVDLTASSSALTPFSVARIISGKEPKDIPNHPFEQLLNHPNELDSRYEFLYATIAFWTLTGNAYWWLNRPDANTPPDEMWFIPSQMIIPVPDENMFLKGYYYYPGNGAEILLPPHEIVHFRRFNPFSRFLGLSAIEAIAIVAGGDLGMQKYNTTLFANNNGRLPSVMTFEQMVADPTWEKIKSDTREASRNREMLMLRGVGQGGVNWLQNSISQREMEFLDGRKANKEEIMTAIAPGSYTMLSENATQANSVVGRASFNELTVYPKHVLMAEKITNSILPAYGGRQLVGRFEDIRVTDKDMKLREQDKFELSHTLKEVREEIYGDDPLGDERDDMLISQINSATGKPVVEPPPAAPVVNNVAPDNKEAEVTQEETEPDDTEAVKADIDRWKRKALKKVGSFVPFDSDIIPDYVRHQIESGLVTCKTDADLRRLFASATIIDEGRVALTVAAIREALNFKVK